MHCCVEMEFAADLDRPKGETSVFNVLQVRPISTDSHNEVVDWTKVDTDGAFLTSGSALGTGWIEDVRDIVYLRPEAFDVLKTQEIASELTQLNARLRAEGRDYALIGFGRWGSSIPSLGVPVRWGDISEARAIVECCLENFRVDPSQGTHFFQNMTSFNVGYVNVNPFVRPGDSLAFPTLDARPAEYETRWLRLLHFEKPLRICVDGRAGRAMFAL
jgi:hypothetical protein